MKDGFLTFPGGTYTAAGTTGGRYFDVAVKRWLPVARQAVSPDGLRYAFTEGWSTSPARAPRVHITDAATAKDVRVVTMPDAQPYFVADFVAGGVYVIIAYEGTAPGVWRVDPATGAVAKVSDGYYVPAGPTWISVVDPSDPSPQTSAESGQALPDRIDYRNAAGQVSTWFSRPGWALAWVAFAGRSEIFVQAYTGLLEQKVEYWFVTGPGQSVLFAAEPLDGTGRYNTIFGGVYSAISDSSGVWLGGSDGLYLATPTDLVLRVYSNPVYPANGCI